MKVKIKIKTAEFKELVSVAKHYASKKYFIDYLPIKRLNLINFVFWGVKKQMTWAENYTGDSVKNKLKTFNLDVNHYEALQHIFNLETQSISEYPKAIFYGVTEQVHKQVTQKLTLLAMND